MGWNVSLANIARKGFHQSLPAIDYRSAHKLLLQASQTKRLFCLEVLVTSQTWPDVAQPAEWVLYSNKTGLPLPSWWAPLAWFFLSLSTNLLSLYSHWDRFSWRLLFSLDKVTIKWTKASDFNVNFKTLFTEFKRCYLFDKQGASEEFKQISSDNCYKR